MPIHWWGFCKTQLQAMNHRGMSGAVDNSQRTTTNQKKSSYVIIIPRINYTTHQRKITSPRRQLQIHWHTWVQSLSNMLGAPRWGSSTLLDSAAPGPSKGNFWQSQSEVVTLEFGRGFPSSNTKSDQIPLEPWNWKCLSIMRGRLTTLVIVSLSVFHLVR